MDLKSKTIDTHQCFLVKNDEDMQTLGCERIVLKAIDMKSLIVAWSIK